MKLVDVAPGEIYKTSVGLTSPQLFLKLANQKAVNLITYTAFSPMDQQQEVEVLPHPLDSYLAISI